MLQQSKNEYTKTTLDPLFLPQLFGAINPKKPEVFQFQLPSINQSGIWYIHSICFPPLVLGQKVGSLCFIQNIIFSNQSHDEIPWDERSGMFIYTYIYVLVFFSMGIQGVEFYMQFVPFSCNFSHGSKFEKTQGSCAWRDCFCNDQHELSGPVLDHSSSLDTPGGLDHWMVGLGFAICLRCLGPK